MIGIVTIARGIYVVATEPMWMTGVREIVIYRLDACMFGVVAAWVKHFYPLRWRQPSLIFLVGGIAMLMAIAVSPFVLPRDSMFLQTAGFSFTSLAAAFLLPWLDAWMTTVRRGYFARVVVNVSLWSYSLYLVQMLVFQLVSGWLPNSGAVSHVAAFAILCPLLAAVVYSFSKANHEPTRPWSEAAFGEPNSKRTNWRKWVRAPPGVYSKTVWLRASIANRLPAPLKARPKPPPSPEAKVLRVPLGVNLKIVLLILSDITKTLSVLSTATPSKEPGPPPKLVCTPLGVNLTTFP